jgi:hypothetical protein
VTDLWTTDEFSRLALWVSVRGSEGLTRRE